jgi:tRNA(fMet)-specific endonuclease VapC
LLNLFVPSIPAETYLPEQTTKMPGQILFIPLLELGGKTFPIKTRFGKIWGKTVSERVFEMYLLDTNTIIYYFKGQGKVAQNLAQAPAHEISISTIVLFELQVGIAKSNSPAKRTQQLQQLLNRINLISFDQDAALAAAKIRAQLEQQGTPIGQMDTLIAGTAVALQATLVTYNVKEFTRVSELTIVDWY